MHANEHPRPEPSDWRRHATCRIEQIDPEVFFPPRGDVRRFAAAKAICNRCPVRIECLQEDLNDDHPWGIFWGIRGGLGAGERKEMAVKIRARRRRLGIAS